MLGNLIGGFIVILIGVTLAPTVANAIELGQLNESGGTDGAINITGSSGGSKKRRSNVIRFNII